MYEAICTVRDLRRRWKPHKERLLQSDPQHPTPVRFHRACSCLQRVEQVDCVEDADFCLLGQCIAFNALYGQWDEESREPLQDGKCWRAFLDRILTLDSDGRIRGVLAKHKRLAMTIFEDEYLSRFFWEEPGVIRAKSRRRSSSKREHGTSKEI